MHPVDSRRDVLDTLTTGIPRLQVSLAWANFFDFHTEGSQGPTYLDEVITEQRTFLTV